jgi:uncharacterized protein (DUF1684 family)
VGPDGTNEAREHLELADWRRQVAALYVVVRERAATDPQAAWEHWRAVREALYREHAQSPLPVEERAAFRARHWAYDPALRFEATVDLAAESAGAGAGDEGAGRPRLPMSIGEAGGLAFSRLGRVTVPFPAGTRILNLFWMAGYAGGLFLPFRDATNGTETYGAGRYLLDAAKSADLGGDPAAGRLVLDFNFAFQPSCAFDPRWACPLAPPENRLDIRVEAGERLT